MINPNCRLSLTGQQSTVSFPKAGHDRNMIPIPGPIWADANKTTFYRVAQLQVERRFPWDVGWASMFASTTNSILKIAEPQLVLQREYSFLSSFPPQDIRINSCIVFFDCAALLHRMHRNTDICSFPARLSSQPLTRALVE